MNWRALLAAGVFVALLLAGVLLTRQPERQEVADAQPAPPPQRVPAVPTPLPPLTRADLIDAAARAADAYARRLPAPPENVALVGRRFTLRLPFGCAGPGSGDDPRWGQWSYDSERQILRASVRPQVWTQAEFVRAIAGPVEFETAEGFWLSRPWIRVAECPANASPAAGATPAAKAAGEAADPERVSAGAEAAAPARGAVPETLALVEFFAPGAPRAAQRNGRPYDLVVNIAPEEIDLSRGLRLVVEGRLAPLPGGQPIACRADTVDEPPLCLISGEVARIAITDASGQQVLAEWTD